MSGPLNVIALISGGKDSFFSLIHCLRNGHRIVALANLYPPLPTSGGEQGGKHQEVRDLQSFMYQTAGHTLIPLYERALGIPLYRQAIRGTAVDGSLSYAYDAAAAGGEGEGQDETESLIPLLRRVMEEHPQANAICTGAILSTYQRTRIESVAGRLGLTSLAYLWKYPILPPASQTSLLDDMAAVGLEARIVKVASGGLDESFLWEDVASEKCRRRVEKAMRRFGVHGDGAVLGEGGEFETVVVDGPRWLFKGEIEVKERERTVVREEGGCAWLALGKRRVIMRDGKERGTVEDVRRPGLFDDRFKRALGALVKHRVKLEPLGSVNTKKTDDTPDWIHQTAELQEGSLGIRYLTVTALSMDFQRTVEDDASEVIAKIREALATSSLRATEIVSTTIILRSMQDFATINKIYSTLFTAPNPPSRVTISSGSLLPTSTNLIIHLKFCTPSSASPPKKSLHVQSTSYWAPANIGPYSQAVSIPLATSTDTTSTESEVSNTAETVYAVSTAGQIPLIPHIMALPTPEGITSLVESEPSKLNEFKIQTILALQHLWRIGTEMDVRWWTSVVAYLPQQADAHAAREKAVLAGEAWRLLHQADEEDEDGDEGESGERDIWEERYNASNLMYSRDGGKGANHELPDWDIVRSETKTPPPFFAVEVEELPRGSGVEWNAVLGVTGGPVVIRTREEAGHWAVHQCVVGDMIQTVVMLYHQDGRIVDRLRQALVAVGIDKGGGKQSYASYVDMSAGVGGLLGQFGSIVPCRSIWDAGGSRLNAVMVFDNLSDIEDHR